MTLLSRIAAAAALSVAALSAQAATVTLNTYYNGWYSGASHLVGNTNTITGFYTGSEYRSFYAFNLPAVAAGETILSASITFLAGNGANRGAYTDKHLSLFDYTGSIDALTSGNGGVAAFADLGSGASYGSTVVNGLNVSMSAVTVQLTSAALKDLLDAGANRFVIGAALQDPFVSNREETLWSASGANPAARLTLVTGQAIPEPGSVALLGAAALAFGLAGRRRKAK